MDLTWFRDGTKMLASGRGMPGERTAIWAVSALTGALTKLREDAWGAEASPDATQIAFLNAARTELWVMGVNGEQPRKLRSGAPGERFFGVAWAPGGRRIAMITRRPLSGEGTIETFDRDGGGSQVLASSAGLGGFCWAPDGRIIFSAVEPPPNHLNENLWEIRTDARTGAAAGRPRRLTNLAGFLFAYLSMSLDGKRLAFLRSNRQTDVWVGELAEKGTGLSAPRRVTLDDRVDWLSGWTRDSQAILLFSDRNGNFDVFKQGIQDRSAEALAREAEEERHPAASPDGAWVLYLARPYGQTRESPDSDRLLRVPVSGGPPQLVLKTGGFPGPASLNVERFMDPKRYPAFRCPSPPATSCVLAEADHKQIVFSTFDPIEGKKTERARVDMNPFSPSSWALAPDGSLVAVAAQEESGARIRIVPLDGGEPREVTVQGVTHLSSLAWSSDGKGFFVTRWTSRGSILLRVTLEGEARPLYRKTTWFEKPFPSPDGRYLAFTEFRFDSNAWMIENLR